MRFIFIIGRGRSGTHFLRNILNNHPDIWIAGEINYFSKPFHKGFIKTTKHLYPFDTEKKIDKLFSIDVRKNVFGHYWENKRIDFEKIKKKFLRKSRRSYKELYRILLEEEAALKNKNIGGEKTPHNIFHLETIIKWFPDAKFLHIIRDPRAVFVSEINRTKANPLFTLVKFIYILTEWLWLIRKHKDFAVKYPNNYKMIKYRELVTDHENSVRNICKFLDVKFYYAMLNPPRTHSSFNETYDVVHGWKNKIPKFYNMIFTLFLNKLISEY